MEQGINYLKVLFENLFSMADKLYTHYGVYPFIYGLFFVFVVVKYLLLPIVGGSMSVGSSDVAADYKAYKKEQRRGQRETERK